MSESVAGGGAAEEPETWEFVEAAARVGFHVWVSGSEVEWAKKAWRVLEQAEFLGAEDSLRGWHEMSCDLLSLVGFYHDFCRKCFDEPSYPPYVDVADELSLDRLIVGYLASQSGYELGEDYGACEDVDVYEEMLGHLADRCRPRIVSALVKGFGGEHLLLASLKATPGPSDDQDPYLDWDDLPAYSWIDDRSPPL